MWYCLRFLSYFVSIAGCSGFSRSNWIGNRTSLLTTRSKMLVALWTVAVRMTPSDAPGWTLITRPRGHCTDGTLSSLRMTILPSWILCPSLVHLLRVISSFRYFLCQRFKKCCLSCWICCHLENRLDEMTLRFRSRKLISESPMRKCPGVRTERWFGSVDKGVNDRELRIDSISMMSVLNCSNVSNSLPMTRLRWRLNDFTAASHSPPKCGEWGWDKAPFDLLIG